MIFQTMSSVCFRGIEGEAVASAAAAAEVEGTRTSVISSNLPATHISLYCLSHRKWRGMTPVPVLHDSQRRRHKKEMWCKRGEKRSTRKAERNA